MPLEASRRLGGRRESMLFTSTSLHFTTNLCEILWQWWLSLVGFVGYLKIMVSIFSGSLFIWLKIHFLSK